MLSEGATPVYPLRVVFEDGDEWLLDSQVEAECTLEWFDSSDPEEEARVIDAKGRRVRLLIERHRTQLCELM